MTSCGLLENMGTVNWASPPRSPLSAPPPDHSAAVVRHPLDPDPVRSSKATAVLALGVAAVIMGPFLGGVLPAGVALVLARQTRADLRASEGFLLGGRRVRYGVTLAWTGIVLAIGVLVVGGVLGLLALAGQGGTDFAPTVN